jgi:hypothetical protein
LCGDEIDFDKLAGVLHGIQVSHYHATNANEGIKDLIGLKFYYVNNVANRLIINIILYNGYRLFYFAQKYIYLFSSLYLSGIPHINIISGYYLYTSETK